MTTHTNCSHPATKAGRTACRKGTAPKYGTVGPVKLADATTIDYSGMTYDFERITCDRCLGSGTYPSSAWNGVCLKCNGKGQMLTRAGRAAKKIHDEWITANLSVRVDSLQPGTKFRPSPVDGWKTIVSIDTEPHYAGRMTVGSGDDAVTTEMYHVDITTKHCTYSMSVDSLVQRSATPAERNVLVSRIASLKGTILSPKA